MKKTSDPRHVRRVRAVRELFAHTFRSHWEEHHEPLIDEIGRRTDRIDEIIARAAPQFPVEKIARVDVAILRLSIYELLFEKRNPPKVIIDEAVELAKTFGGEGSPTFVNGVLGTLLSEQHDTQNTGNHSKHSC